MRKIAVLTFLTLDGVMQSPGSPEEDSSNGFAKGGWARPCWDEVMEQVYLHAMDEPYDMLCGRTTYDMFAANFPETGESLEIKRLNEAVKYVVTSHTDSLHWKTTIPINGESLLGQINQLKQEDGRLLQIHGSWQLVQQLLEHDLVDEYRLWTFPVVVGSGKRLFGSGTVPSALKLTKSDRTKSGAVMAFYGRG